MKPLLRLTVPVLASLMFVSGAPADENWIHAQTEHFEMFSCASERQSRDLLGRLEQFRATVLKIYPLRLNREPPTTVVLFDSDRQFEAYRPVRHGKAEETAGYCLSDPYETMIVLAARGDAETSCEIIFHEYVHLLLAASGDNPPLWLNEGLAEFFSTFEIRRDRYIVGRHQPALVAILQQENLMPLERLFAVTEESAVYHEGDDRNVFYAESWLLVHQALCGEDHAVWQPALQKFTRLIAIPGAAVEESFRQAFGMDYAHMERQLRRDLLGSGYGLAGGKLVLGDVSGRIKFGAAETFARDLALLDLRWRLQHPAATSGQLLQAAAQHPESPRPHELLAEIAARDDGPEAALPEWQRAADLGSTNAYVYLTLARDRLGPLLDDFSLDYRLPAETAALLRGWLDRAVSLNPGYWDAAEALLLVEAMAEVPRGAVVNRLADVVPQMRDRSLSMFALAEIHRRVGHVEFARKLDDLLLESPQVTPRVRKLAALLSRALPPPTTGPG